MLKDQVSGDLGERGGVRRPKHAESCARTYACCVAPLAPFLAPRSKLSFDLVHMGTGTNPCARVHSHARVGEGAHPFVGGWFGVPVLAIRPQRAPQHLEREYRFARWLNFIVIRRFWCSYPVAPFDLSSKSCAFVGHKVLNKPLAKGCW